MFHIKGLAAAVVAAVAAAGALAATPPPTGKQVVEEQCAVCHASGKEGAPKIGDSKAWAKRAKAGLSGLTASAIEGVRKMPPHGGKLALSDLEIKRAITYMVNRSGGQWIEPVDRAHAPDRRKGEQVVKMKCAECHAEGKGGAPKVGDSKAWTQRARLGFDSLVASAIHGHGAMQPRGGMADLTDAEVRDAVAYMLFAREPKQPPPLPK
jgi:cytochrome c5